MLMNYKKVFIITLGICFLNGSAIVSSEPINSLNLSVSFMRDNEDLINDDGQIDKHNSDMLELKLGCVFKSKYELAFMHKNINDTQNGYLLPFAGGYNFFKFNYHIKERERFPLNISIGINSGNHDSYSFSSFGWDIVFYKLFKDLSYPFAPYIALENYLYEYDIGNDNFEKKFMHNKIGAVIILPVKNNDNIPITDSIWIDLYINHINQDLFLGLSLGLHHPISI